MDVFAAFRRAAVACASLVLLTAAAQAAATDRWVNGTGGVDTGNCSVQVSPCQTIAYAIGQASAGDTVHIAAGVYDLLSGPPLTITKAGLILQGEDPNNKPQIRRTAGTTANQALLVVNNVTNVQVQNLEFDMDQSFVAEGIIANGFVDGPLAARNFPSLATVLQRFL